jgi:hypothetical protein
LGKRAEEIVDPYAGYYGSGAAGIAGEESGDERLKGKALVVGLAHGDTARAYPLETVRAAGVINDRLGPVPLLLLYDATLQSVLAYQRQTSGQTLTFVAADRPGVVQDVETGSLWEMATGRAVAGPLAGERLARQAAPLVFWFAWSDLHPEAEIFSH